jgi:phage protein D
MLFYSRPQLESQASVGTIEKTDTIRFQIHKQQLNSKSYGSCVCSYFDPLSKKLVQALANDPNSESVDTLAIVERLENSQQATLRAQSHLHVSNMQQIKGEITMPGTMIYRAGNRVTLSGFGAFDSVKFIVEEAHHSLRKNGYTTRLRLRTTITGATAQVISEDFED